MRFKKGSEIEVWNKREVLSGSWWPAELLSGNGHTYCVRYERPQCEDDQPIMERVPRKAIRPRPPLVGGAETWMPGVVVEVFDSNSWKTARILKVVRGGNWFIVKLLGSSREFGVYAHNVRVRQSWVDNQWVLIGEVTSLDFPFYFNAVVRNIWFYICEASKYLALEIFIFIKKKS